MKSNSTFFKTMQSLYDHAKRNNEIRDGMVFSFNGETYDSLVAIDPGVHTGIAYWDSFTCMFPNHTTQVNMNKSVSMEEEKILSMVIDFSAAIGQIIKMNSGTRGLLAVMESVELWNTSAKSSAAGSKGDLSSLAYLVGAYSVILSQQGIGLVLVKPTEWKGQMSDAVVKQRIARAFSGRLPKCSVHVRSAIGMKLSLTGDL